MNAIVILFLIGQPQAPTIPQSPPMAEEKPVESAYAMAARRAREEKVPLVVFVGAERRDVAGHATVAVSTEYFNSEGYPSKCVIVSDKNGNHRFTLSADATDAQIRGEVSRMAIPFSKRSGVLGRRATADDDLSGYGPWPKEVEKIKGLKRYVPATMTQMTFNKGVIQAVPIRKLEPKWHQSGGMEGIEGWRSDLYKFVPQAVDTKRSWVPVFNGSNDQLEHAFTRSYPDGTTFLDVLSTGDKVFEVRQARKDNGKWNRKVIHRDESAYPSGYTGLKQSCASCHDEAGTGGYAVGLVPGGDTVLSDPIPVLEAGYSDPFRE